MKNDRQPENQCLFFRLAKKDIPSARSHSTKEDRMINHLFSIRFFLNIILRSSIVHPLVAFSALVFFSPVVFSQVEDVTGSIFILNENGLSHAESDRIRSWISDTEARLPRRMKTSIPGPIRIRFQQRDQFETMPIPTCGASGAQSPGLSRLDSDNEITLNRNMVSVIAAGEENAATFPCEQKNLYRMATAELISQVAVIYDNLAILSDWERREQKKCSPPTPYNSKYPPKSEPIQCRFLRKRHSTVSSTVGWLNSLAFSINGTNGNTNTSRTAKPDELATPQKSFAVNMGYFLLDQEFQCRHPALNDLLVQHFGSRPFPKNSCALNTEVLLQSPARFAALDLNRLYQVHYLIAGEGEDFSSTWGHAMFRLVFCAPERPVAGPECLQDINHHVVLSFRAFIEDFVQNAFKGLTGRYPSLLFLIPFPDVWREYVIGESRTMKSIPLKLSREEAVRFVHLALEKYWGYEGRYYFLTNNCATESWNLLAGALGDLGFETNRPDLITPGGLSTFLKAIGRADFAALENPSLRKSLVFNGLFSTLEKKLEFLRDLQGYPKSLDVRDLVQKFNTKERQKLYRQLIEQNPASQQRIKPAFLYIEDYNDTKLQKQAKSEAAKLIARHGSADQATHNAQQELLRAAQEQFARIRPKQMALGGYGVPLAHERLDHDEALDIAEESEELVKKLSDFLLEHDLRHIRSGADDSQKFRQEILSKL